MILHCVFSHFNRFGSSYFLKKMYRNHGFGKIVNERGRAPFKHCSANGDSNTHRHLKYGVYGNTSLKKRKCCCKFHFPLEKPQIVCQWIHNCERAKNKTCHILGQNVASTALTNVGLTSTKYFEETPA